MKSLLFLSGFLPSARVPSGGQQLVHRELERLAREYRVTLLAFRNEKESAIDVGDDFASCRRAEIVSVGRLTRLFAALRHPRLPAIASARFAAGASIMRTLCRETTFDRIHCEFIQAAGLLRLAPVGVPSTLVVHDFFHEALARRAEHLREPLRSLAHVEAKRTKRWEAGILHAADGVLTLTERDRETAQRLSGRADVGVRYPTVPRRLENIRRDSATIDPHLVLFFGLLSRAENEDAVLWFVREVWPEVMKARPRARFVVAGAAPTESLTRLRAERVSMIGYVEDPVALLSRAAVAVAPLRMGAGIKIKVVEALAAGLPTVATPIGAEGVRPSPLLTVADSASDFARACIERLSP
jgi:glycosyltransferase involved in cell wall biosynthesis